jgi:AAA+ superfamily predicted ATPase
MSEFLERTLQGLRRALEGSPDNGMLHLQIAETLAELGRIAEARDACVEAAPHLRDRDSLPVLGQLRRRLGGDGVAPSLAGPPAGSGVAGVGDEPEDGTVLRLVQGGGGATAPAMADRIDFSDVGGLDAVKEDVRMKIVLPFQRPDLFAAYGKKRGGGILMYGPPGCGKTLLARATAGECGATFQPVAIDQVLDMWFGESERKLAALFDDARRRAPTVLFFDEVEAIGGSRQQLRNSPGKTLVNQLLVEMDGIGGGNDRLLVVAATNAPWHVDRALLRPGRFDRVIFVPPPDADAREQILKLELRGRPVADDVNISALVSATEGWSGADLAGLVERAVEGPLREALKTGTVTPIRRRHVEGALAGSRSTTADWFATAKNYATFANPGGIYDDLVRWEAERKPRRGWFR